jgi:hypothetical protein
MCNQIFGKGATNKGAITVLQGYHLCFFAFAHVFHVMTASVVHDARSDAYATRVLQGCHNCVARKLSHCKKMNGKTE